MRRRVIKGSPAPTKSSESAAEQTLPPSIAALTSMRDQATPITADERRARTERARKLMAEHKIDALMLTSGTSMVYFANVNWSGGERLFAVVIPQKGEPFAVCPSFEEERAREQLALGPFTGTFDVRTWQEHQSPYALVAAGLKDRGIVSGRTVSSCALHSPAMPRARATVGTTSGARPGVRSGLRSRRMPWPASTASMATVS